MAAITPDPDSTMRRQLRQIGLVGDAYVNPSGKRCRRETNGDSKEPFIETAEK